MNEPRKHHYLPQFYLRGFSTDCDSIYQIEKSTLNYYPSSVRDVAAKRDFHKIDHEESDPNALEKFLAETIEPAQALHLKQIIARGIRDRQTKRNAAELASVFRMRVAPMKENLRQSYEAELRTLAKLLERSGKFPKPPPGYEDALKVENLRFSIKNWKPLQTMFGVAFDEDTVRAFFHLRQTIYWAPFGDSFITGDQPVSIFHPDASVGEIGAGPATPGVEITFPLSSNVLLKFDHMESPYSERVATTAEVEEFNRRTIVMADKYVFAGQNVERYLTLVRKYNHISAGFRSNVLDMNNSLLFLHRFIPVGPR